MDKYGVAEVDTDDEKTSSLELECPRCGGRLKDLDSTGGIKICPTCGTEPFEAV